MDKSVLWDRMKIEYEKQNASQLPGELVSSVFTRLKSYQGGGGSSTSRPVNCLGLQTKQAITLKLGDFPKWALAKFGILQIRNRPFVVATVTNLSRVDHDQNQ